MESQFSKHQVLIDLGLTLKQARVYLALVESGPLKIALLSKAAKVARPDVYSTLSKLHQIGLVEKIIKKPITYSAVSMREGLSILLETKTRQYEKVRAETRLLLELAKKEQENNTKNIESSQFVLIPEGKAVLDRINASIKNAQHSIDLVLSWKRFSCGMVSTFADSMENAWSRQVKTRFILEQPSPNKTVNQLLQFCRDKSCVQIRFMSRCPETVFGIYDKKELFVVVFSEKGLPGSPALWSNNRSLIALAQNHFEILWLTSPENLDYDATKPDEMTCEEVQ